MKCVLCIGDVTSNIYAQNLLQPHTATNMLITPTYHTHSTWIHTEFDTSAQPVFCQRPPVLSSPSRPPVSEPLRLGGLAAWRQGLEAPVHTGLHCRAICRLDHWAAGTRPWGWLLPWGNSGGRMTQRQTGRDDAMSGISNSLTGSASNYKGIRLGKKPLCGTLCGAETFCCVVLCEPGRTWTPVCTGSA